ncbi:MAG: sulfatase [Actinomycetota bacterium]|nr:sulfatase [Actinomycetota bacterium]
MRRVGACALALVAALAAGDAGRARPARAQNLLPPNILIIVTDDQRPTGMSEVMPKTDRIFGMRGTDFKNAYATTPLCCPSRASIFTGRYAHNHGVRTNRDGELFDPRSSIQRYLKENRYRTGIFGKYILGQPLSANPPYFDEWAIFQRSPGSYHNGEWNVNGTVQRIPEYSTDYIADQAVDFIGRSEMLDIQPWMMFLTTAAPHAPFKAERDYRDARISTWEPNPAVSEVNINDKPPYITPERNSERKAERTRTKQLRTLMSVDDMVGEVFRALQDVGEGRDTLAIYTSDNGFLWGEHRLIQKKVPYLPAVRVPFMLRWPGRVTEGLIDQRLVGNIDIAPTVLDAAGINPDPEYPIDGRSLLSSYQRSRLLLEFWQETRLPSWAATKTQRYHYIEYYDESGGVLYREFYDLATDPWQLVNLYGDRSTANDPDPTPLAQELARDRVCVGPTCP